MKDPTPHKLIRIKTGGMQSFFSTDSKSRQYIPVDESFLIRQIAGFSRLNKKARAKEQDRFLKSCEVVTKVRLPDRLPNVHRKIRDTSGKKHRSCKEDMKQGAIAILPVLQMFKNPEPGALIFANILTGLRCTALRKVGFEGKVLLVSAPSSELQTTFSALTDAVVTRSHWKDDGWEIHREAILNFADTPDKLPRHIQDFTEACIRVKHAKNLRFPAPYVDTVALLIRAESTQLREALPYMEHSAVFLMNCSTPEGGAIRIPSAACAYLDPDVLNRLRTNRDCIAELLAWWRGQVADEPTWARNILQRARSSFTLRDTRYISVVIDPKLLLRAIFHEVLQSFLDELESHQFLTAEHLSPYRVLVKEVFDPTPTEETPSRSADDPAVFLQIMRNFVKANLEKIISENDPFVKINKPLAAWRKISGEDHLVFPEKTWMAEYRKAARAAEGIDCYLFSRENWGSELQRDLCEAHVIKAPAAGGRYRYDLFQNGTRDTTYVVAIPAKLLGN